MTESPSGTSSLLLSPIDYISIGREGWIPAQMMEFKWPHPLSHKVGTLDESNLWKAVCDPLVDIAEPWRSNYHSFVTDLYAYSLVVNEKYRAISIATIHDRSLSEGPSFAKWIDGFKAYILGMYAKRLYYSDEVYKNYQGIQIPEYVNISAIYRSNFCFFWAPPKESVRKYCCIPVVQNDKYLTSFRHSLREYLNNLPLMFASEISWKPLVKSSGKGTYTGKNAFQRMDRPATTRGRSRIAFVNRELKGARTACVEEPESVLAIRWIEQNVSQIIDIDPRNKMKAAPATVKLELEKAIRGAKRGHEKKFVHTSYCRDFEKEGLTKPRNLLRIMLEELYTATGWPVFSNPGFYDTWNPEENGEEIISHRGHGLGMANSLTTLMQIIIEIMVSKSCNRKPIKSFYCNDDAAIIFKTIADAKLYAGHDRHVCEELGLAFKEKQSYIAEGEVSFCEQYAHKDNAAYGFKESHNYMGFFNLLKCANVAHARMISSSTNITYLPKILTDTVMQYWGWCLFRNEFTRPADHGGWFARKIEGVNTSFVDKTASDEVPREEMCARIAFEKVQLQFYPWDKRTARERLYEHIDPGYLELAGIKEHLGAQDLARPGLDPYETKRAWDAYLRKLRKVFSDTQKAYDRGLHRMTWQELFFEIEKKSPEKDSIPPIGCRVSERRERIISHRNTEFHSPYGTHGLEVDSEIYTKFNGRNEYNIRVGSKRLALGLEHGVRGWKHSEMLVAEHFPQLNVMEWGVYIYPEKTDLCSWHDPFTALAVSDSLGSEYSIYTPTMISQEKRELLSKRKDFYGRELTIEEWVEFGKLKPIDQIFMFRTRRLWASDDILKEGIIQVLQAAPGIGRFAYNSLDQDTELVKWLLLWRKSREKWLKRDMRLESDVPIVETIKEFIVPIDMDEYDSIHDDDVGDFVEVIDEEADEAFSNCDLLSMSSADSEFLDMDL